MLSVTPRQQVLGTSEEVAWQNTSDTHTSPIVERLAVELSLSVFTALVCHGWDSNIHPSDCGANALTHCATAAASRSTKDMYNPSKVISTFYI